MNTNYRIADNVAYILESIHNTQLHYGNQESIQLVAVSKYSNIEEIKEAYDAGMRNFGENKVQDLAKKKTALATLDTYQKQHDKTRDFLDSKITWHFIGRLQDNKINMLLRLQPTLLHSLHSLELAHAIQKRLKKQNLKLRALLQVNSTNEKSKQGFMPSQTIESYLQIQQECPLIELCGLMCMGAHIQNSMFMDSVLQDSPPNQLIAKSLIAKSFSITRDLFVQLKSHGASVLSMGMSSDYKIAIAEGSNCLRIGSQIFKSL